MAEPTRKPTISNGEQSGKQLDRLMKLWILFVVMSFLGWVYETILEVCIYQTGFSNRGLLMGFWLPIYGIGGLLFVGSCYPFRNMGKLVKPFLIFLTTALIATTVELGATYILEYINGSWPWDYTRYAVNFQGRIALSTSVRFGLCGMIGMYIVYPATDFLCKKMKKGVVIGISVVTLILFCSDLILSLQ